MNKMNEQQANYLNKRLLYNFTMKEVTSMKALRNIDKYDYEANCEGCTINDYDKYERHRIVQIMLLIGILGLYFVIGFVLGISGIN